MDYAFSCGSGFTPRSLDKDENPYSEASSLPYLEFHLRNVGATLAANCIYFPIIQIGLFNTPYYTFFDFYNFF